MKIDRHAIELNYAKELFDSGVKNIAATLEHAKRDPKNLDSLIDRAVMIISCGSVVDPDSPHILPALRLGAQAHAAMFATVANTTGPVTVPLGDGEPVTYHSPPDESTVYPQRWVTGFYMNTLCQDTAGLDLLDKVKSGDLRKSSTRSPSYDYLYMDALQLFRHGKAEMTNKVVAALQATDPNKVKNPDPEWALYLPGHQLEVLMYVATHGPEFSRALGKAVQRHKEYWSKKKDRRRNEKGFISLELTALAALGQERDLPLEVESPYLFMKLASQ